MSARAPVGAAPVAIGARVKDSADASFSQL
jgi:hypothetical protein